VTGDRDPQAAGWGQEEGLGTQTNAGVAPEDWSLEVQGNVEKGGGGADQQRRTAGESRPGTSYSRCDRVVCVRTGRDSNTLAVDARACTGKRNLDSRGPARV
jgi:hypothetical protein